MSRHQTVRNLDYDEVIDEYEGEDLEEYETDQISSEDREAIDVGTATVQSALGPDADKVTTQQIQDALWYYYYDIDKTVSYLKKKFIVPPVASKKEPKKVKDDGLCLGGIYGEVADHETASVSAYPIQTVFSLSPASFFQGVSWTNVPRSRQAVLVPPRTLPGGLLGGGEGPKPSKLQALATARKKKMAEAKESDTKVDRAEKKMSTLAIDEPLKKTQRPGPSILAKRQKLAEGSTSGSQASPPVSKPQRDESASYPVGMEVGQSYISYTGNGELLEDDCFVLPSTRPSAFAMTLFHPAQDAAASSQTYNLPYIGSSIFVPSAFSQPSPDDIVLAAQAKAGTKFDAAVAKSATKKIVIKPTGSQTPIGEMKQLQLNDALAPKHKKLNVVKEFEKSEKKRSASFVVVGHVDAGKSTLMGRLLLELKYVEQHVIDRYRRQGEKIGKSSFALAWVMDQREEERERGVTIDIATNQFETARTRFTILDAPGHRDFVPNMIAGASQADFAILVIDANTGAFEKGLKGQTREHALLLRSLGVQRVIVAVNKLDMVGWSKERFDEISEQVTGFMKGNGFQLKNITFVPISGLNGANLVRRPDDEALSWYTGPVLIEALEDSDPITRALDKPFRMSISETYKTQQSQLTVTGRIESGTVQNGESLVIQPSGESASVRSIEVDCEVQDWAVAGQNVNISLCGIDPIHVRVGDIISPKAAPIETSETLKMKVLAFDHLMPMPVDVHRGRLHAAGRVEAIPAVLDKVTGAKLKKNPKIVQPGKVARVIVKLESKVPLEAGQRVVLRNGGETIAAGLLE